MSRVPVTIPPPLASEPRSVGAAPWWVLCAGWMLLAIASAAVAQEAPIRFARIGVQDGLPDSHVRAIHQDRDGFLWFSTRDGLARYDGYDFTVFRHDPFDPLTIHGNWVQQIYEDDDGNLWIPLGVGGIDLYQRQQQTFRHVADRLTGPTGAGDIPSAALRGRNGDMWFATVSNGVFRWHGQEERLIPLSAPDRHGPGVAGDRQLLNPRIGALLEDRHGRIWIGSCAGLDVFDPLFPEAPLLRFPITSSMTPVALAGNSPGCARTLYEDAQGNIWLATAAMGVLRLRPREPTASPPASRPPQQYESRWVSGPLAPDEAPIGRSVRNILATADGLLWFTSTDVGLSAYDPTNDGFSLYPAQPTGAEGPASNNINRLHLDRQGRLWIGTFDAGLTLYDPVRQRFTHFRHDPRDPQSLSGDAIASIFEDAAGNLWIGTFGEGANVYSPYRWKFKHYAPHREGLAGPTGRVITSLAQTADGRVWIGSFDGGLDTFDPEAETFEPVPLPEAARQSGITAMEVDADGQLWVGTSVGLLLSQQRSQSPSFSALDVLDLQSSGGQDSISALASGPSRLWIGTTANGLLRLDPQSGRLRRYPLDPGNLEQTVAVWALLEDHLGQVWIGTPSFGLHRFDPRTETFTIYRGTTRQPGDLDNRTIKSLFEDSSGRLWIGTFSGGLNLFDRQRDQFIPWTVHQGLPSNKIEAIRQGRDGELWLSTNRGLASLQPDLSTTHVYDRADGLQHDEFQQGAALATADGELYFGGRNGFNRFRPDRLQENPQAPPVVITKFRKFGKPVHFDRPLQDLERIVLAHHENVISFEFAALDFAHPKKNRYRYRLQGFDPTWVEGPELRQATYTNLDPGNYVFEVQGSNNDGVWNELGASLHLRVVPPFWLRWWFFLLEGLTALGILIFALYRQRRRLERRQWEALRRQDHRRKTRELDFARQVQLSMLPTEDLSTTAYEAVGRMVTASEVGGDYFDYIGLSNGRHCIALGDAIGHGSAAGLVVGMVKATLHQALGKGNADHGTTDPAAVLATLNRTLHATVADRRSGMGLSVLILDDTTDERGTRARLASTAMPYPYLYRQRDGDLISLELGGFPLGLGPLVKPRPLTLALQPGDILIMVSDGVVERRNAEGDMWGYAALESTLKDLCRTGTDAVDLASRLISLNHLWGNGREPDDDLTVVVLRIR